MSSMRLPIALIAATAAVPASAAEVQIPVQNPVVELTINEVVQSAPDVAMLGCGVQVRAPTASEALRQNAKQMEQVIARLRKLGIAREDIQTSQFSLNGQFQYANDGTAPRFIGYDATNQVNVTLRKLDKIGDALDALVLAGATNVYGPNFSLEKDQPAKATARKAAFERARAQAQEYAGMAGYKGLRLLEVSETYQAMGPVPVSAQAIVVTALKAETVTPVEPGRVGTGVTLTVKYEMTR